MIVIINRSLNYPNKFEVDHNCNQIKNTMDSLVCSVEQQLVISDSKEFYNDAVTAAVRVYLLHFSYFYVNFRYLVESLD
jgi:hypothetical protein